MKKILLILVIVAISIAAILTEAHQDSLKSNWQRVDVDSDKITYKNGDEIIEIQRVFKIKELKKEKYDKKITVDTVKVGYFVADEATIGKIVNTTAIKPDSVWREDTLGNIIELDTPDKPKTGVAE